MIYREKDLGETLCHFNPNHDPRNGQFASKNRALRGTIIDRAERKYLERKVKRFEVNKHRKAQTKQALEEIAELKAFRPFQTYRGAERALGSELRSRTKQAEYQEAKKISKAARAFQRLAKYWDKSEIDPKAVEQGLRYMNTYRNEIEKIKMSSLYKDLGKEYRTTVTVPFNEGFMKNL